MSTRLTLENGDTSSGSWDGNTQDAVQSSGVDSTGQTLGSATVTYITNSASQQTAAYSATVPSVTSGTIKYQVANWKDLVAGTNQMQDGSVINYDPANNTAIASFSKNGISYQINFSLEADGDTVDATFIQSNGITSTAKYSASLLYPSFNQASTMSVAGARHTMAASTAGKVAAVATGVAAVAVAVATFAPVTAPVAVPVAAVAGVVAAGAAIWDAFTN